MRQLSLFLSLVLIALSTTAQTITGYRASTLVDGTQLVYRQYSDGTQVQVDHLPTDAVRSRLGGRSLIPYAPENKRVFNPAQFGTNKYYSPTFRFSVDFVGTATKAQRLAYGVNTFNDFSVAEADRSQYSPGEGQAYITESGIHHTLEGEGFYVSDLQTYYNMIWSRCPAYGYGDLAFMKYLVLNIETSSDWKRDIYGSGLIGWPSWDVGKTKSVKCETDGVTRTVEQIQAMGDSWWQNETYIRRTNRYRLLLLVLKQKSHPSCKVSIGASPYQGRPRTDFEDNSHGVFLEGSCKVDAPGIGGDAQGNITFNNPDGGTRTYQLTGSAWDAEDFCMGYYYWFNFDISGQDYQDIWINKLPGTQNYPYLWSKIKTVHIVADEKGYIQLNRKRMLARQGVTRPFWRMCEPMYEGDGGFVDGGYPAIANPVPFPDLQNPGGYETPKVWQQPYAMYSRYAVTRFFAGNEQDWGFYLFPTSPQFVRGDFSQIPLYNHDLHTVTALFQARADMQPLERFYTGSTLVEDPEVQLNGVGSFSAYNATAAYNYAGGVQGVQKPAYMLRYKQTATGWTVYVLGGMNQDWTAERTDIIRVPGGGVNGNMFRVKLRGPAAQIYEFSVNASDSGQIYEAVPTAQTNWEKAGYGGRVN
ncbi:hypothetical protein [Spirosoma endbachense]|uniref:Uncharacterized protein n=1 Tax=Spirosoma endbachense TaxID=2666025 RepID=A0A6P1W4I0_9BACT|nr:hypothetical protein [Spirosoma endbachense]QHV99232.1 hypothetical protein GJR95_31335 [Spirosoma endbachense]